MPRFSSSPHSSATTRSTIPLPHYPQQSQPNPTQRLDSWEPAQRLSLVLGTNRVHPLSDLRSAWIVQPFTAPLQTAAWATASIASWAVIHSVIAHPKCVCRKHGDFEPPTQHCWGVLLVSREGYGIRESSGVVVGPADHRIDCFFEDVVEVSAPRIVIADTAVQILVRAPPPGRMRIAKEDRASGVAVVKALSRDIS